jgi:quercetin dioxygenase-like cupin family protein
MAGKFNRASELKWEKLSWGELVWLSGPHASGARELVVGEVKLAPGGSHHFHKHPRQEELIYVLEGEVEQWLRKERRTLKAGDSIYIPRNTVHATFNVAKRAARCLAILAPAIGKGGYELVDVNSRAPWKSLR